MSAVTAPHISPGKQYSLVLHLALLVVMIFGLPDFLHKKLETEPEAISVQILPMAPVSNVKPQERVEPKPEKKPVEKEHTERKPTPEAHKVIEKPQPKPIPVPTKNAVKIPVKKMEKPVPKKTREEDPLASVLNSVKEEAKAEASKRPTEKSVTPQPNQNEAKSDNYNASMPLSMSEKDAIRQQLQRCWVVPAGAKDAQNLVVNLHITVGEDGTVTSVELSGDQGRYSSDSFFRAAADSAIRGVRECSPLKNLPSEKYGNWRDMDLTFDPKDVV